jgi:hypothetical protein
MKQLNPFCDYWHKSGRIVIVICTFILLALTAAAGQQGGSRRSGLQNLYFPHAGAGRSCKILFADVELLSNHLDKQIFHIYAGLLERNWKKVDSSTLQNLLLACSDEKSCSVTIKEHFAQVSRSLCGTASKTFVLLSHVSGLNFALLSHPGFVESIQALREVEGWKFGLFLADVNSSDQLEIGSEGRNRIYGNLDVVYSTFSHKLPIFYPSVAFPPLVWIPVALSLEMQTVAQKQDVVHKVIVMGNTYQNFYPARAWAAQRAFGGDPRIVVLEHPGYGDRQNDIDDLSVKIMNLDLLAALLEAPLVKLKMRGKAYAEFLSYFLAGFTDLMRSTVLLSKNVEIAGAGSLLMTSDENRELLSAVGFEHGVNCFLYNHSNPEPSFDWVLNQTNSEKVNNIRSSGRDLVHRLHLVQHRSEYMNSHVESILSSSSDFQVLFNFTESNRCSSSNCPHAGELLEECTSKWRAFLYMDHPNGDPESCVSK